MINKFMYDHNKLVYDTHSAKKTESSTMAMTILIFVFIKRSGAHWSILELTA